MWEALRTIGGPLDDRGALVHLRETTCKSLIARYARWMKWLTTADVDAILLPPTERATLARLQAWLETLAHTKPLTRLAFVEAVLRILRAAAPEHDWTLQNRLLGALKQAARHIDPARKSGRILSSTFLLELGLAHANASTQNQLQRLIRHRDGTMIALLAVLPMRRRSFCELSLGQSIHVSDAEILISLSEDLTKTGVSWEAAVAPQVEPLLRRYIEVVRPSLIARGHQRHDILWVGKKGEIIGQDYIGTRIGNLTLKLTGKRVPPHFFRDAAATTLSRMSPESARLIRPVLAHFGFRTAERHYIHAQTIDAGRNYASLIKRLKDTK
jgi:integrase/recombinase XerD